MARLVDGTLVLDRTAAGRGAWLCAEASGTPEQTCMEGAVRRGAFARAFRAPVGQGALDALQAVLRERARMVDTTTVVHE